MHRSCWPAFRRRLQRSTHPVLVGPFRGEVGFECLYWLPFLRKLGIPPERLIALTRGGAGAWYPADRSLDIYSLRTPKQVRIENIQSVQRTGMLKPLAWSPFDRALVTEAAAALGLTRYHTLHPLWMYHVLAPFWETRRGFDWLSRHVDIQTLKAPELELALPAEFVAVRFYARTTFPLNEAGQTIATETVKQIAQHHPVVLLDAGVHADEHVDIPIPAMANVHRLADLAPVTAENNLVVQSHVISKALGFVGTYGGLAQLALMYKKPTVSFYQDWHGTMVAHKHYADAVAMQLGVACQVVRVTEIPLLHTVLPSVTFAVRQQSSHTRTVLA